MPGFEDSTEPEGAEEEYESRLQALSLGSKALAQGGPPANRHWLE